MSNVLLQWPDNILEKFFFPKSVYSFLPIRNSLVQTCSTFILFLFLSLKKQTTVRLLHSVRPSLKPLLATPVICTAQKEAIQW